MSSLTTNRPNQRWEVISLKMMKSTVSLQPSLHGLELTVNDVHFPGTGFPVGLDFYMCDLSLSFPAITDARLNCSGVSDQGKVRRARLMGMMCDFIGGISVNKRLKEREQKKKVRTCVKVQN